MTISEDKRARLNARQFFGRRKGPTLRPRQRLMLERYYPRFAISLPSESIAPLDLEALFPAHCTSFALEIGFGKGEHLAHQAVLKPETGFIGCEPFMNGMASFLDKAVSADLQNVRVYDDDAREIIDALPDGILDAVYLLHPDPWHKRRHARRRFINPSNLDALARILKPGGLLQVVTDDAVYRQWTAIRMNQRADFEWEAERPEDWTVPPPDWLVTRYAAKADREGRRDCFFQYRRL